MRVLVTGANGFVGSYLVDCLLKMEPDSEIIGLVHEATLPTASERVRYVAGDIMDADGLRELLQREGPDHIYHLAGAASGAAQDRDAVFRINVAGTRHLMTAIAAELPLARVLFTSTGYVYGECSEESGAREDSPVHPVGIYAESKREAESYALAEGAFVVRAFNHTGPGQVKDFAIPAFAGQIAAIENSVGPTEMSVGNLEAKRDFLDVRDVVRAYALLMAEGQAGEIYNVCSGKSRTMRALLDMLLDLSTVKISVTPDPARMRPADIAASVGNPAKLQRLTGWQPEIALEQTLADTLAWWRSR